MKIKFRFLTIAMIFCSLGLPFAFTNCQAPSSAPSTQPNQDTGNNLLSSACTDAQLLALEAQMNQALQTTAVTESFYLELQRNLDGRIYTFSRSVPNKTTVNSDTALQAASTAKLITAAVILDVIAHPNLYPPGNGIVNGRPLTLDSLARQFLPKTGGGTMWSTAAGPISPTNRLFNVSLRHLLSFTSGLEEGHDCINSGTVSHNDCIPLVVAANINLADNTANTVRTFYYSGSHLFVAAQMAVNASGLGSWAALFKRFKENHGVFQSPVRSQNTAVFGVGAFYPYSTPGANSPNPAGAMRYQAGDYAPFLLKLVREQIIDGALLDQMLSNQLSPLNAPIKSAPNLVNSEAWNYGLGLWAECPAAQYNVACHEGRYSSPGAFGSYPFIDYNPTNGADHLLVGFVGYGGTVPAEATEGIAIYRSLGGGSVGVKDLAQKWAANRCQ